MALSKMTLFTLLLVKQYQNICYFSHCCFYGMFLYVHFPHSKTQMYMWEKGAQGKWSNQEIIKIKILTWSINTLSYSLELPINLNVNKNAFCDELQQAKGLKWSISAKLQGKMLATILYNNCQDMHNWLLWSSANLWHAMWVSGWFLWKIT